ncbi:MAG: glycoside hydrolase family 3 C-terminal domain-containing protein [Anaerolineaceae bacterium]
MTPSNSPAKQPVYLDPSRPVAERVEDLLSRLTLEEKISQMVNGCPGIPRLGIPAYDYWNEALHGVARNGRATVFPQAIGMAATWDRELILRVATAISDEGRAKFHETMRRKGHTALFQGLTFWSPNVNIFRDPRWGRGQETWGEDPYLTGEMASAFVHGLQGDDPKYIKAAACAKHFAVHSGPEKDRHTFNAKVSLRDLNATYLPAFKKLVTEAKVEAVMGAYNRTNGEACCASPFLLEKTLRQEWGFAGHVTSDCTALTDLHQGHKLTKDVVESAALALKAGCDISCMCTYDHLGEAIERGLCSEADVDLCLGRTLATRFKLGMFDPQELVPYSSIPMRVVNSPEHRQLAYEAALKSVVLLKNKNGILPIKPEVGSVMVLGPHAASVDALMGNYYGMSDTYTTLLAGIAGRAPEGMQVQYRAGCQPEGMNKIGSDWTLIEAGSADLVIACMGLNHLMEGEEGDALLSAENGDRADIALPAGQSDYLRKMAGAGARIVLVLFGGSPIALCGLEDIVEAVVFIWYPGQEGGRAVADVLFGDACPSGKLPVTFPKSLDQLPPFTDYNMAGRTYRYATAEPLYPFGFGLSYTTFAYSDLRLAKDRLAAGEALEFEFMLANTGAKAGEEVVQVYLRDLETAVPAPLNSLVGFQRVRLAAGESKTLSFDIPAERMMLVDNEGQFKLEAGRFHLLVGSCSPGRRGQQLGAAQALLGEFEIV